MKAGKPILVASVCFLFIFVFRCTISNDEPSDETYLNHSDTALYLGKEACASCHFDKMSTFVHTGMGMSFDSASRAKSSAVFSQQHILYDSFRNFYYQPFWRNDQLFVKEYRLKGADTIYSRTEQITYIIGSGQHTNSHLIQKNAFIVQAPFTWYAQKAQLDFPPGFENGSNSRFTRVIDQECMSCHNAMPKMVNESNRQFAQVGNGIDCERCHGPGSIHVKMRSAGLEPPAGSKDYSIVNPSKLSWERQIDVCQRCHLQGNNVLKPGKTFLDFKPGMILSDYFEIYLPKYADGTSQFNMANHADRFQSSQCFIKTNAKKERASFTCISCHNPHVSVQSTNLNVFNSKCSSCHTGESQCSENDDVRLINMDNCVACHMPKSGTEDIPHVTVHDHKIGIYRNGSTEVKSSQPIGLYSVNNPNPEPEILIKAYLTYYEKFSQEPIYQKRAEELLAKHPNRALQIHLDYQKQAWIEVIRTAKDLTSTSNLDAHTCYRIGKAFSSVQNYFEADQWLSLACVKAVDFYEYFNELGANCIKMNNLQKAEVNLLKSYSLYNEYEPTLNNLGYLYILEGNYAAASKYLHRALSLNPDNMFTLENLVLLADRQSSKDDMIRFLNRILEINPQHKGAREKISSF